VSAQRYIRWENVGCNVIYLPRVNLDRPAPNYFSELS
jgi:hypothetical protein